MTPPDPGNAAFPDQSAGPILDSNAVLIESVRHLQAREAHLQGLLESAPDSVMGMNIEGLVTDWSLGAERVLGWTREEAIGKRMSELIIPPKYREAHEKGMRKTLETGVARVINRIIEIEAQHKSGEIFPVELSIWTIANDSGNGFGAVVRDVSSRYKAQNALRDSEERYRLVVEHLGEGMFVAVGDRIVFANRMASDIMRIAPDEMLGSDPIEWVHPDDRAGVVALRTQLMLKEVIAPNYELRHVGRDGVVRWLNIRPSAVKWEGHNATVTFFSDVTERRNVAEALQRTSSEREAILNNALVGIVFGLDRSPQWVNDKFAEMVGYSREELVSKDTLQIHANRETWEQLGREQRAALAESGTYSNERQLKRKNGELFWVQMAGQCIRKGDFGAGVIWTFLDITERRNAEEDTRAALVKQRELNDLRSRFVAMTSHEFRTPLATILSSAELLKYYGERLPKVETLGILKTIEEGVQRMTLMLDRVLLLGKADAHMLEFQPAEIDLMALCKALLDEARSQHASSGCEWTVECVDLPPKGQFDAKLLRHIFGNLLSNAAKYSPRGSTVLFRISGLGGRVVFEVADQGIGIPTEEIPYLFQSFHRASNVGDIQGTGLGLAIVKNSVDLHGGTIEVSSTAGLGTRFTVTI